MGQELTAAEAAARLGVKRETLYAYVSRGLVHRHMAMDGRTSLFDSDEVDALRSGRRKSPEGELDTVISTGLTNVTDGSLRIRGEDVVALVRKGASYEEIVALLWGTNDVPWTVDASTLAAVRAGQEILASGATPFDRLRLTTSVVSAADPLRFDLDPGSVRRAGGQLIAAMILGLPLQASVSPSSTRLSDQLWPRLTAKRATQPRRHALNAAMALLVDHGLAASTLAARVAASVRGDPYSVVTAGLGAVGGPLHGAASGNVHALLSSAASKEPATAVGESYRRLATNVGFGHKVYTSEDPRYSCLMGVVSNAWATDARLATVHAVRDLINERTDAIPNIDMALGALTWLAGMEANAGEAIFAIARTAGWLAHGVEEYNEAPLRFRPRARYTGPR
jgi:citrate synthase